MKRHVYKRPKANRTRSYALAVAGGLVFTFLVFYLIPLMKKLEAGLTKPPSSMEEGLAVEPPDTFEPPEVEPPPEEEIEEPPEMVEQTELDLSLDIPLDLGAGTGGGIKISVPNSFQIAGDADSFGTGDVTSPPRPTARVDPRYPRDMLKKKRGGRVLVTVTVDERGIVTEARIKESSGHASLDKAALTAAKRWKFKAGIKEGRKAVMTAVIPFNFKVKS